MRLTDQELDDYLADIAKLLERYGTSLDPGHVTVEEAAAGARTFDILGSLPDGRQPPLASLAVRETWRPAGASTFERAEYAYELMDRERGYRRDFHLHDRDVFIRRFDVVVHEHCENPLGLPTCEHYEGTPLRDAFAGVLALMDAWTGDPPDCSTLRCLE